MLLDIWVDLIERVANGKSEGYALDAVTEQLLGLED